MSVLNSTIDFCIILCVFVGFSVYIITKTLEVKNPVCNLIANIYLG